MSTIQFSVHRNPGKDAEGNDTYHVRQETFGTVNKQQLMAHIAHHGLLRPELLEMAMTVLEREIVEHLLLGHRLHWNGLGTFFLRLGLRDREDSDGLPVKPHFTDPSQITGNDVQIEGIGFTPDAEFLSLLDEQGYHFENYMGRGTVGHTATYSREEIEANVETLLAKHGFLTRRMLMQHLRLTDYMARKWLDALSIGDDALLLAEKTGSTIIFRRR